MSELLRVLAALETPLQRSAPPGLRALHVTTARVLRDLALDFEALTRDLERSPNPAAREARRRWSLNPCEAQPRAPQRGNRTSKPGGDVRGDLPGNTTTGDPKP